MTASAAVLEVDDLHVSFPGPRSTSRARLARPARVRAVDGVSFTVGAGELVALVGESGSGKTTTAQGVLRLIEPTAGVVRLGSTVIGDLSRRQLRALRARMQLVYQDPYESLDPRHRVRDILAEPILIHELAGSSRERDAKVRDALDRVGLSPPELYLDRYPHELSGGQRQRVAIAASLALAPDLLILDEPVSMLDVSVRASILELFADLRRAGLAILMITHDLATVAHYADRLAVMYLGRIVEEGPVGRVIASPRHPYTRALLSVVPSRDIDRSRRELLNDDIPDAQHIPDGCRFRSRCPRAIDACAAQDPELESVAPDHRVACIRAGGTPPSIKELQS